MDTAHSVRAQAVFRGDGGDEIFCRNASALYVADLHQDAKKRCAAHGPIFCRRRWLKASRCGTFLLG